jgi:hypothetical protein
MSDADKAKIVSVNADGSFVYVNDGATIYGCSKCSFEAPETIPLCPKCGTSF